MNIYKIYQKQYNNRAEDSSAHVVNIKQGLLSDGKS